MRRVELSSHRRLCRAVFHYWNHLRRGQFVLLQRAEPARPVHSRQGCVPRSRIVTVRLDPIAHPPDIDAGSLPCGERYYQRDEQQQDAYPHSFRPHPHTRCRYRQDSDLSWSLWCGEYGDCYANGSRYRIPRCVRLRGHLAERSNRHHTYAYVCRSHPRLGRQHEPTVGECLGGKLL